METNGQQLCAFYGPAKNIVRFTLLNAHPTNSHKWGPNQTLMYISPTFDFAL